MTVDLAIAGAGPAGASAAITAAERGLAVALFERSGEDGGCGRDKVCGEFISAEALPLLRRWLPELVAQAPEIQRVRLACGQGRAAAFALPQTARGLSRRRLDAALRSAAAAAGAVLYSRTAVARIERAGLSYRVSTATGEQYEAQQVIWAAGRQTAGGRSGWLGLKAHVAGLEQRPEVALYALRGGYCGLAPVEGGLTNLCCLLRMRRDLDLHEHDCLPRWLARLPGSAGLAARLNGAEQVGATVVTAGITLGARAAMGAGGWLQAGDASGFVDPFTGDGIARALLSGHMAATMVADGLVCAYAGALHRATHAGWRTGRWLRAAVMAPGWVQAGLLPLLAHPAMASRLTAATRWRTL
ncbi:MAG: NAD(P)/FAD-dependent oxidoreductase [Terriglobales bacterium]